MNFNFFVIITILTLLLLPSITWNILQAYYMYLSQKISGVEEEDKETIKRKYSIIVAIKNEDRETIVNLIENLRNLNYDNYEVIIVSDDSEEKFNGLFKKIFLPNNFRILRRENPIGGKAGALNYALKLSTGDYLLFLDADARIDKDFLLRLSKRDYTAASFRLRIYDIQTSIQKYYAEFTEKVMTSLFLVRARLGFPIFPNGSAFSIRKEELIRIGGWKVGSITEDLELGIRLFLSGVKVVYYNDLVIYVKAPYTLGDLFRQIERWSYGSSQLLFESLKLFKSLKGIEGFMYAQQWGLYPSLIAIVSLSAITFPLLKINQFLLLVILLPYILSLLIYSFETKQKEIDVKIIITIINASLIGYLKGLFRIPFSWKVTPKTLVKQDDDKNKSTFSGFIQVILLSIAFFDSVFGYWFITVILVIFSITEQLA